MRLPDRTMSGVRALGFGFVLVIAGCAGATGDQPPIEGSALEPAAPLATPTDRDMAPATAPTVLPPVSPATSASPTIVTATAVPGAVTGMGASGPSSEGDRCLKGGRPPLPQCPPP